MDEVLKALKTDSNGNKYVLNHDHKTAIKTTIESPENYRGGLQSHHGLQQEWAKENLKAYGYKPGKAPTITLETNRFNVTGTPHTNISGQQVTYNEKNDIHSGTLEDRLILGANQQLKAGVSKEVVLQDLENNYKMIDKLNKNKASEIEAGQLPGLTYSRENIENNLQEEQQKSDEKCS